MNEKPEVYYLGLQTGGSLRIDVVISNDSTKISWCELGGEAVMRQKRERCGSCDYVVHEFPFNCLLGKYQGELLVYLRLNKPKNGQIVLTNKRSFDADAEGLFALVHQCILNPKSPLFHPNPAVRLVAETFSQSLPA
jgi:hypothetical protein